MNMGYAGYVAGYAQTPHSYVGCAGFTYCLRARVREGNLLSPLLNCSRIEKARNQRNPRNYAAFERNLQRNHRNCIVFIVLNSIRIKIISINKELMLIKKTGLNKENSIFFSRLSVFVAFCMGWIGKDNQKNV